MHLTHDNSLIEGYKKVRIINKWFTYIYLTIFGIFIGCTLFSGIINIGISAKYPFLWYGGIILAMGVLWLLANAFASLSSRFVLHPFEPQYKKYGVFIECIIVVAVITVGAGLRVWVIQNLHMTPASDYKTYYDVATLLSQGNLIKDGVWLCDYISQFPHVIGYPYILSIVFKIFGVSVTVGLYFNLVASLISIFLAYQIARLICGRIGGMIALVLVAFWPSQILYINHLASEPIFMCITLLSIWLAVYLSKYTFKNGKTSGYLFLYIALGISLAVGAAVRPMSIILLIAIVICILPSKIKFNEDKDRIGLIKKGMSKGWIRALAILISYLLCSQIISGAISKTIDRELPGSSVSFGYNLLVGLNIDSKGAWNKEDAKMFNDAFLETDSAIEAHKVARDEAFKRIQKDSIGMINLAFEKYALLWSSDDYAASFNIFFLEQQNNLSLERKAFINELIPWNNLYYLLCVFFSFIAGIALWFRKKTGPEHILVLFFIGTAILHMILESQNRYHYNILPIFAILAAVGISEIFDYYRKKTTTLKAVEANELQQEITPTQVELSATQKQPLALKNQESQENQEDKSNKFDMLSAIKEGHVVVTVSEAYLKRTHNSEVLDETLEHKQNSNNSKF